MAVSTYVEVDDTGARHRGHGGSCTHIGNELFAVFASTDSKSRLNFLDLLRRPHTDYVIDDTAVAYWRWQKLPKEVTDRSARVRERLRTRPRGEADCGNWGSPNRGMCGLPARGRCWGA